MFNVDFSILNVCTLIFFENYVKTIEHPPKTTPRHPQTIQDQSYFFRLIQDFAMFAMQLKYASQKCDDNRPAFNTFKIFSFCDLNTSMAVA